MLGPATLLASSRLKPEAEGGFSVESGLRLQQSNGMGLRRLGDDVTKPLVGEHCNNLSEEL
jgi:hypothetical protein